VLGCSVTTARHPVVLEGRGKGQLIVNQSPGGTREGVSAEHNAPGKGWVNWEMWRR